MMVLCPLHHDQATKGAMSEEEQRALKAHPFNRERGYANGFLSVRQNYCAADMGSITVVGEGAFLSVGNTPVLGFHLKDRALVVSVSLFDQSDDLIAEIFQNEWISGDPTPWDIEADWQKLVIRRKSRDIALEIDAKKIPMSITGRLFAHGHSISIGKAGLLFGTTRCGFHDLALVGTFIEINKNDGTITFGPQPPFESAALVSGPNTRERLWRAKAKWKEIRASPRR